VFGAFSLPYRRCPQCGGSVAVAEWDRHVCEPERLLDYQMFQRREELAGLEDEVRDYLSSPRGRFELWDAERRRRPPA
jgi:hypothetical protein